jgi:metallo-beta-lactamase family protein
MDCGSTAVLSPKSGPSSEPSSPKTEIRSVWTTLLHHLKYRLPDSRNAVVLVGYQVPGSRGRQLVDGAREIKMFGEYIDVLAEIVNVPGLSVHADRGELLGWLRSASSPPRTTYVVHGEKEASESLRDAVRSEIGSRAVMPQPDEIVFITR